MKESLPPVLLLDLDDTIISFDAAGRSSWVDLCAEVASETGLFTAEALHAAIDEVASHYWSDPERHRIGRLSLEKTRLELVRKSLSKLGIQDDVRAADISMRYGIMRDSRIHLFHDSIEALEKLSARTRLALVTNGESGAQRAKISRFNIERFFEKIFVEEEVGVGKPDVRAFENVLREMKIRPSDAWMVGDNLQWDVAAPMKLGIKGIWFDYRGKGLPENPPVIPDRVIRSLTELL